MSRSPVSATLTATNKEALLQAITTIIEKLPFFIDLLQTKSLHWQINFNSPVYETMVVDH